jgi:predicted transcriptional regulator
MAESEMLTVRVSPETKKQLEALAKETKRSKSFLAAEAISSYLETQAWQLEQIKAGIADLDAGRTVSGDKVLAWIRSWGTANEVPPPECD